MELQDFAGLQKMLDKNCILSVFKGPRNLRMGQVMRFTNHDDNNYFSVGIIHGYHNTDLLSIISRGYESNGCNESLWITDLKQGFDKVELNSFNNEIIENPLDKWVFNNQTYTVAKDSGFYKLRFHYNSKPVGEILGESFVEIHDSAVKQLLPSSFYKKLNTLLGK